MLDFWKRMHGSAGETVPPTLAQALEAIMPAQCLLFCRDIAQAQWSIPQVQGLGGQAPAHRGGAAG